MVARHSLGEHALEPEISVSSMSSQPRRETSKSWTSWEGDCEERGRTHDHISLLLQRLDKVLEHDRVVHLLPQMIFRSFDRECTGIFDQERRESPSSELRILCCQSEKRAFLFTDGSSQLQSRMMKGRAEGKRLAEGGTLVTRRRASVSEFE